MRFRKHILFEGCGANHPIRLFTGIFQRRAPETGRITHREIRRPTAADVAAAKALNGSHGGANAGA